MHKLLFAAIWLFACQLIWAQTNDPLVEKQWWRLSSKGSATPGFADIAAQNTARITVAVLDTGLTDHPDWDTTQLLPGLDFIHNVNYAADGDGRDSNPHDPGDGLRASQTMSFEYKDCTAQESSWHGTQVMGLLAAHSNNAMGVASALDGVQVLPIRVAGRCGAETQDVIDAMRWAAGFNSVCQQYIRTNQPELGCFRTFPVNPHPARIINLSFGSTDTDCADYREVIQELTQHNILVIAAAGNDAGAVSRPANCPGVVAVTAINRLGFKADYANWGPQIALATVGGDVVGNSWDDDGIWTLSNLGAYSEANAGYAAVQGSSFAAPLVSAAAAAMLQWAPQLSAQEILEGLRASAKPHVQIQGWPTCSALNPYNCNCTTATCGAGILDLAQALQWTQNRLLGQTYHPQLNTLPILTAMDLGGYPDQAPADTTPPTEETAGGATGPVSWTSLLWALAGLVTILTMGRITQISRHKSQSLHKTSNKD